jgi:hypothetical protein
LKVNFSEKMAQTNPFQLFLLFFIAVAFFLNFSILYKFQNHSESVTKEQNQILQESDEILKRQTDLERKVTQTIDRITKLEKNVMLLSRANAGFNWMLNISNTLSELIHKTQNPPDCAAAKYHYCPIIDVCGAGCVIHQTAYCFLVGLASGRVTLIGSGWKYLSVCGDSRDWNCFFEPVSSCQLAIQNMAVQWTENSDAKVTTIGRFNRGSNMNYFPWAASDGFHTNTPFWVPPSLEPFRANHSDIRVVVVGHIENYIMRIKQSYNEQLMKAFEALNLRNPYVGIHVRRTDHRIEAPFRELSEYLVHADKWFESQQLYGKDRHIYLATDESQVIKEALEQFTSYSWHIGQIDDRKSGAVGSGDRSGALSTLLLFLDWYALKNSDLLVGTSSSQVSRMAYELMQAQHFDKDYGKNFISLDDPWYFP